MPGVTVGETTLTLTNAENGFAVGEYVRGVHLDGKLHSYGGDLPYRRRG